MTHMVSGIAHGGKTLVIFLTLVLTFGAVEGLDVASDVFKVGGLVVELERLNGACAYPNRGQGNRI